MAWKKTEYRKRPLNDIYKEQEKDPDHNDRKK